MIDEKLVNYIKESLKGGQSEESIKKLLIEQGWSEEDLSEAFNTIKRNEQPNVNITELPKTKNVSALPEDNKLDERKTIQNQPKRPIGVLIISILGFISGFVSVLGGILLLVFGSELSLSEFWLGVNQLFFHSINILLILLGILFIFLGAVEIFGSFLLFKMRRIGWLIVMILGILFIILSVLNIPLYNILSALPGISFQILIILYLLIKRKLFV